MTHRERVVTILSYLLDSPEARPVVIGIMLAHAGNAGVRSIVDDLSLDRDVEWP